MNRALWDNAFAFARGRLLVAGIGGYWNEQLSLDYAEWVVWGTWRTRAQAFGFADCRL